MDFVVISDVVLEPVNAAFIRVVAEPGIINELADAFSFYAPNYKYHPKFKYGIWDGKLHILNRRNYNIYAGLQTEVEKTCERLGYSVSSPNLKVNKEFSLAEASAFVKGLNLPAKFEVRDYQLKSFVDCVRARRALYLSPTASGKSLIIYFLTQFYSGKKLIIVPTTSLVEQMAGDFEEYGYQGQISKIYASKDKENLHEIAVSTWQSAVRLDEKWFKQFTTFIGDEAHKFQAKSLVDISGRLSLAESRFGFTGSLDGSKTNEMVLQGLFGPLKKQVTTDDLIQAGHIAKPIIKCIQFKYPEAVCKQLRGSTYAEEKEFIVTHEGRNNFIKNLALSLKGNTMVLFQYVDKQGKPLYELIRAAAPSDLSVEYISGETDTSQREETRIGVLQGGSSITVASQGVFSTGINIPGINNIIFASPSKSRILIMQSIGRGLRLAEGKTSFKLFDLADDLSHKKHTNYTFNHFAMRLKFYIQEKFQYKLYKVDME